MSQSFLKKKEGDRFDVILKRRIGGHRKGGYGPGCVRLEIGKYWNWRIGGLVGVRAGVLVGISGYISEKAPPYSPRSLYAWVCRLEYRCRSGSWGGCECGRLSHDCRHRLTVDKKFRDAFSRKSMIFGGG